MSSQLEKYVSKKKSRKKAHVSASNENIQDESETSYCSNSTVYGAKEYDDTFRISKKVLSWVAIRMGHNISETTAKYWERFYWFELINVLVGATSEVVGMVSMVQRAESFREAIKVFRMIPCFGCVIMGYYWCNIALLVTFMAPPYFLLVGRYLGYNYPMMLHFIFWLPFDAFQPYAFEFLLLLQTWQGTVVIFWNISWDMLFCTFLSHITTQLDVLASRVRHLVYVNVDQQLIPSYPLAKLSEDIKRRNTTSTRDWEERHQKELTDIVLRHQTLIRLAGDVEEMFSFGLLVNFMNSSVIICFCGFCCVLIEKWNDFAYKSFLLTALSQTWLLCWYGQKLIDSSLGVSAAMYESGWYSSSKKTKSSMLIMLHRAQKSVHVTTYGFSPISLASFSTIIKTAWSYFTLLLNVYNSK